MLSVLNYFLKIVCDTVFPKLFNGVALAFPLQARLMLGECHNRITAEYMIWGIELQMGWNFKTGWGFKQ